MLRGAVYRNGARLGEPYAMPSDAECPCQPAGRTISSGSWVHFPARPIRQSTRDNWGPLVVPGGHYLVLGDDRGHSIDTRHTGFVPRSEIRGKVLAVHWSSGIGGVRWSRIGTRP